MTPLFPILFIILLTGLTFHRTHLLSTLLCLEGMMLLMYITLSLWTNHNSTASLMLPLIMLTLSACEAGLGLSLMIATARSQGSDNLKTMNLLQW